MDDARKLRIMKTALLLIAFAIVIWVTIQLAIGANATAAFEERQQRCLVADDYFACLDQTR